MKELENLAERVRSELNVEFNAEGVKFIEGFIERNKSHIIKEDWGGLINSCGAFLGQCVIENYGGEWHREENGQTAVVFNDQNKIYPFSKVAKQFDNGLEDSIYSMYTAIPVIFKRQFKTKKKWWQF